MALETIDPRGVNSKIVKTARKAVTTIMGGCLEILDSFLTTGSS